MELLAVGRVKPYRGNSRTHSCKQIKQIAQSIERFGFTNPVPFSFRRPTRFRAPK